MLPITLYLLVFLISPIYSALVQSEIEWYWVPNGQAMLMRSDPVGLELDIYVYLCRAEIDGHFIPGKYVMDPDVNKCNVARNGREVKYDQFQMLAAPPGVLSWDSYSGTLPQNGLVGGTQDNNSPLYICRGIVDNRLMPGFFNDDTKICHIPYYKEEQIRSHFEILVLNEYGLALLGMKI